LEEASLTLTETFT